MPRRLARNLMETDISKAFSGPIIKEVIPVQAVEAFRVARG
jgi:hypothetical protein